MNKFAKVFAFVAVLMTAHTAFSQDNSTSLKEISNDGPFTLKPLAWRIFAGPEMAFLAEGDQSVMKGGMLGVNAGIDINKRFNKTTYGIVGVNLVSGGFERWVNDNTSKTKSSYDKYTTIEIPLGIGFDFGKNPPLGFFTNVSFINSFTTTSSSEFSSVPFTSFEVSTNVKNNTLDFYNFGAKVEFGVKCKVEKNNYSSFSLSFKPMFLNRLSTNTSQYTSLNAAAIAAFYF